MKPMTSFGLNRGSGPAVFPHEYANANALSVWLLAQPIIIMVMIHGENIVNFMANYRDMWREQVSADDCLLYLKIEITATCWIKDEIKL